jgi:hypothetical protein
LSSTAEFRGLRLSPGPTSLLKKEVEDDYQIENTQLAPNENRSYKSADGRVATEAAWLNGKKREELMERARNS